MRDDDLWQGRDPKRVAEMERLIAKTLPWGVVLCLIVFIVEQFMRA